MNQIQRMTVIFLKKTEILSAASVRLTKITKKSKTPIHPKHLLDRRPWYIKFLDKKDTLLDLGCHNGQNTIKSSRIVKKAIGLEIDNDALNIARSSSARMGATNVTFRKADLEQKLNFKDNSFSKVLFLDVLEHLKNRTGILGEIQRILKKDGLLILGVPNSQTSWKKIQRAAGICSFADPDHKIEFSEKSIKQALEKAGFKIIHFGYGKYDTPYKGIIDLIGSVSLYVYKKITIWRTKKVLVNPQEASGFEIVAQKI